MKILFAAATLAALLAGPALAQTATQTITDAVAKSATDAATRAATDQVNKAAGVSESGGKGKDKASKTKDNAPNYGSSMEHRMDDEKKKHGKDKNKKK